MTFDKKFGADFINSVPTTPGVYRFYLDESLQYVGKAKSLRQRLRQYRNAGNKKKDRKHRAIVKESNRIVFEVCESEHGALLLENEIIQSEKPRLNIAGAFSFLYPCLGLKASAEHTISIVYSTVPESFLDYVFYGAFRSKPVVRPAFESLVDLLSSVGHPERADSSAAYSTVRTFRRIPEQIGTALPKFMAGESDEMLEFLILELLERNSARKAPKAVQEALDLLSIFYRDEVLPLREAKRVTGINEMFVPQEERDAVFISAQEK